MASLMNRRSHPLLPRTRYSQYEHGGIGRRNRVYIAQHIPNGRAAADYFAEALERADLRAQAGRLLQKCRDPLFRFNPIIHVAQEEGVKAGSIDRVARNGRLGEKSLTALLDGLDTFSDPERLPGRVTCA